MAPLWLLLFTHFFDMKEQNREKILETLLVLSLFFLILFFLTNVFWILYVCAFFLAIGVFENSFSKYIAGIWLSFSSLIGKISTFILLSIVFYLLITPIGLLWRILKPLESGHFLKDIKKSLWEKKNNIFDKEYFEKTW